MSFCFNKKEGILKVTFIFSSKIYMSDITPEKLQKNSDNDVHWDEFQNLITKFEW